MDTGKKLYAGALARTVLAQKSQNFSGAQLDRNIGNGNRAAKNLRDAFE
jgi:hypothetical protein